MAINLKALASWGLMAEAGGSTQVITSLEVTVSASEALAVELGAAPDSEPLSVGLEAAEIAVELREDQ
jgi:hypothetical protein